MISLAIISFVLGLSAGSAIADDAVPQTGLAVTVTRAASECFSSVVRATGYIVPRTNAVVMFNAPGFRIAEVSAKEGDTIKSGYQVALAIPLTQATSSSEAKGVEKDASQARVPIKSLASGTVVRRNVEIGMPLSANGGPLFAIAVDGEMEALIDVPSVHVLELSSGQSARISMDDGQDVTGHVRLVPVEINKTTQVGQARLSIDGDQTLRMGQFVRVSIDSRRSCGLGVPLAALTHESDGIRLQVVKNGTIETRLVTLGLLGDSDAEVVGGLADGDLVVSDAGTSLRDGDKVRPIAADQDFH